MLKTPVITPFIPINSTQINTIKFSYTGSNQVVKNNLVIETLDGDVVYNQTQSTFLFNHSIPIDTLVNGGSYRAKIRVADISNTWSSFSDNVIFYALSSPTLSILSIDEQGKVYNQTVNFQTSYSHPDSELLQSYQYKLYDSNQNLLSSYSIKFSDGSTTLDEEITGLGNNTFYYIEVLVTTVKGQLSTTGKIQFLPYYAVPKMASGILVENLKEQGMTKIDMSARQITFNLIDVDGNEIPKESIEYIENTKIDMNRVDYDKLVTSESFAISQSDFTLQLWLEDVLEGIENVIFRMYTDTGYFCIFFYDNRFHCFKTNYNNSLKSHFVSNKIVPLGQTTLLIKCVSGLIEMETQNIS